MGWKVPFTFETGAEILTNFGGLGIVGQILARLPFGKRLNGSQVEGALQRLRQRIFAVSQKGNLKQVRHVEKLMLRSYANALLSVRRVTELNADKMTSGVDGRIIVIPAGKARLARQIGRLGHAVDALLALTIFVITATNFRGIRFTVYIR